VSFGIAIVNLTPGRLFDGETVCCYVVDEWIRVPRSKKEELKARILKYGSILFIVNIPLILIPALRW